MPKPMPSITLAVTGKEVYTLQVSAVEGSHDMILPVKLILLQS